MTRTVVAAAVLFGLMSVGTATSTAAAPVGLVQIAAPATGVLQARATKKHPSLTRRSARRSSLRRTRGVRPRPVPAPVSSTRAEQRVRDINSSLLERRRDLGAAQQNQFEVNQLRQEIGRGSLSSPPSVGVGSGRICPPGAGGC